MIVVIFKNYSKADPLKEATVIYFGNGGQTKIFMPFDSQTKKEVNCNLALFYSEGVFSCSSGYSDYKVQSCKENWKSKESDYLPHSFQIQ